MDLVPAVHVRNRRHCGPHSAGGYPPEPPALACSAGGLIATVLIFRWPAVASINRRHLCFVSAGNIRSCSSGRFIKWHPKAIPKTLVHKATYLDMNSIVHTSVCFAMEIDDVIANDFDAYM